MRPGLSDRGSHDGKRTPNIDEMEAKDSNVEGCTSQTNCYPRRREEGGGKGKGKKKKKTEKNVSCGGVELRKSPGFINGRNDLGKES